MHQITKISRQYTTLDKFEAQKIYGDGTVKTSNGTNINMNLFIHC